MRKLTADSINKANRVEIGNKFGTVEINKETHWDTLTHDEQEYLIEKAEMSFDKVSKKKAVAMAKDEAWTKSPFEKARREEERIAFENEKVTCEVDGKEYARKDCLTIGDNSYAFVNLSEAERKMYGITI